VDEEPPTEVRWLPASEIDEAIARELMGQEEGGGPEPEGGIESGGTTVIKRYVPSASLPSQWLRTGRAGQGSGSVILDDHGRWLADQRFCEVPRSVAEWVAVRRDEADERASESYPTDWLFTGMGYRDCPGCLRVHLRLDVRASMPYTMCVQPPAQISV
jgi:hypothetical protein